MNAYTADVYAKVVSITANVLVLGAVTLSMYMASFSPETHLSAFCSWFFSLLVPIIGGAVLAKRFVRQRSAQSAAGPSGATASNGLTGVRLAKKTAD